MHRPPPILVLLLGGALSFAAAPAAGQAIPRAADDSAALYQRTAVAVGTAATRLQATFRLAPELTALSLIRAGYGVAEASLGNRLSGTQQALLALQLHLLAEAEKDAGRIAEHNERKQEVKELIALFKGQVGGLPGVADLLVGQARATTEQALEILLATAPTPKDFALAAARTKATGEQLFESVMTIPGTTLVLGGQALDEAGQTASEIFGAAMAAGKTVAEAVTAAVAGLAGASDAEITTEVKAMFQMVVVSKSETLALILAMMQQMATTQQRIVIAGAASSVGIPSDWAVAGIYGVVPTVGGTVAIMVPAGWSLTAIATGFEGNLVTAQAFVTGWTGMPGRTKGTVEAVEIAKAAAQSDYAVTTVSAMITVLKTAGYSATAVAAGVVGAITTATTAAIASGLLTAGFTVAATAEALKLGVAATATVTSTALLAAGTTATALAIALRDVYDLDFLAVAKQLKDAFVLPAQAFQAVTAAFVLTNSQATEALTLLNS